MLTLERNTHLTVGPGDKTAAYSKDQVPEGTVHFGQAKLLFSEIQFFTLYWDPVSVPQPLVVYVGSANGRHLVVLARMFPQLNFHLYDPAPHVPELSSPEFANRITIFSGDSGMFTDAIAQTYANRNDIFLLVDIRDSAYTAEAKEEQTQQANEDIVMRNMTTQMQWYLTISPIKALLKFRLPYTYEFHRFKTVAYLDGILYKQVWGGPVSTEVRLVPYSDRVTEWDYAVHQAQMFYHNTVTRVAKYKNADGKSQSVDTMVGLLSDFDSVVSELIIKEYMYKFGIPDSPKSRQKILRAAFTGCSANPNVNKLLEFRRVHNTVPGDFVDQYNASQFAFFPHEIQWVPFNEYGGRFIKNLSYQGVERAGWIFERNNARAYKYMKPRDVLRETATSRRRIVKK